MPVNVQDIYLTAGTELRMIAPSSGTARVEWFGGGAPPKQMRTFTPRRGGPSKRLRQLRKHAYRQEAGRPSYREKQAAARASKAARRRPNYGLHPLRPR